MLKWYTVDSKMPEVNALGDSDILILKGEEGTLFFGWYNIHKRSWYAEHYHMPDYPMDVKYWAEFNDYPIEKTGDSAEEHF